MTRRNMLPAKNINQQGSKAVYDTFRSDTSCKSNKNKYSGMRCCGFQVYIKLNKDDLIILYDLQKINGHEFSTAQTTCTILKLTFNLRSLQRQIIKYTKLHV